MKFIFFLILYSIINLNAQKSDDYYDLLGVSRDATVKEIRKAFKTLAVKLHPDKNKDDKDAESKFIKLAKAYEVLKEPELRKQYDLHGEQTFDEVKKKQYHSYSYYKDQFGIYDDDPLIVTLSRADYEVNILDDTQAWFINFYSPHCHHCHELAPTWRQLARELEGVIRIAAVNCEDDYALCYQLSIESYPSLIYYEKESHMYEGLKYRGERTLDALKQFIFMKINVNIQEITPMNWDKLNFKKKNWLLFLCGGDDCPEEETRQKLAATLESLVSVGIVHDLELSNRISKENSIVFWHVNDDETVSIEKIDGADSKELVENFLSKLPNPEELNDDQFKEIRTQLRLNSEKPWLICFYLGTATDLNLQLKRLPSLLPAINIGLIHCGRSAALCASLHVVRYPTWGVLKVGGAFELHHGRDILHEIATFARDSVKSTNLHALSPADFKNFISEDSTWFIDWFAPWCPPCKKLMPEIRKASQQFQPEVVQFGTIDCTSHRTLCQNEGITSYPTVILYNRSQVHRFLGMPNEPSMVEFIRDMLNPIVITLDDSTFVQLIRKPKNELWAVEFYAPWCGPCQKFAQEWRTLAKTMASFEEVKIAHVDCVANADLCASQDIRGYPTIRLYPLGSKGLNTVAIYSGARNAVSLKRWILGFLPSPIESFNADDFKKNILTKKYILPWLVDFYAPWCGHCIHFEPEFRTVAIRLEGHIRTAKVDCEAERFFCGHQHVNAYPTVRLYLSPTEFYPIDSQEATQIIKQIKKIMEASRNNLKHDEL